MFGLSAARTASAASIRFCASPRHTASERTELLVAERLDGLWLLVIERVRHFASFSPSHRGRGHAGLILTDASAKDRIMHEEAWKLSPRVVRKRDRKNLEFMPSLETNV